MIAALLRLLRRGRQVAGRVPCLLYGHAFAPDGITYCRHGGFQVRIGCCLCPARRDRPPCCHVCAPPFMFRADQVQP